MSVEVSTLRGGLTVATDRVETVATVSLGAWVGVGTRHEPAPVNGIAHMLEHMAFKGTERRSAYDIAREIEAVGGHLNAYTSRETTAYYARVLSEDVPLAVDIVADILQYSTFDEEELERERAVILQEIGQANDTPDDVIFDRFQETAYPGQALGRPVLGTAETVSGLDRATLRTYMRDHYTRTAMVVAAAGDIEHARFVDLVAAAFDSLPDSNSAAAEPARYGGGEFREARELEQVHLVLGLEAVGYLDPDYYVASLTSTLLGGGMSSRLFQEVREKRGLVYSIYSFVSAYRDGGLFGIYAGTGEREVTELIPVVCAELSRLTRDVDDEEVARARAQLKASILMSLESMSSRCEQLAQQILGFGRPLPVPEIVARIEAVDGAAVRRFAARLLASRPTLASLGPIARVESLDQVAARLG
ncbi:MAG: insulinase family protein [Alphaproteobacteria bacterium]|nr:MAG: insulinase family protein [Alphaproteobacteria bacterium]